MKNLLLLTVAAGTLSACGSSSVTEEQLSQVLSQADTYAPTYDDGLTDMGDAVTSDAPSEGIAGFMGMEDGSVQPVMIRLSEDEQTAYVSIGGGSEVAFDIRTSGREGRGSGWWVSGENSVYLDYDSEAENYVSYRHDQSGRGYYGLQTAPGDLPEAIAVYAGSTFLANDDADAWINIIAQADFAENAITGFVTGDFSDDSEEGLDPYFAGALTGQISDSEVGMAANVAGADVSGTIEMLGAFYDDAETIAGGIGATLNDQAMGGEFSLTEGIYSDF